MVKTKVKIAESSKYRVILEDSDFTDMMFEEEDVELLGLLKKT